MNPYKDIPWTARCILATEYEKRVTLHKGMLETAENDGQFDRAETERSSVKFFERELAKVDESLS